MRRTISAFTAFLILAASCLPSVAYSRELMGSKIYDKVLAFSHMQEPTDKVSKLKAKYDKLLKAFIDQQDITNEL